jgi:mannose/fructose/N-acetylgalactosamine-specific phosphotransferase system component IIC
MAWDIMGLIAIAIGAVLLAVLYLIIRKQLKNTQSYKFQDEQPVSSDEQNCG